MNTNGDDKVNSDYEPSIYTSANGRAYEARGGLTKREHFASLALQGIVSMFGSRTTKITAAYAVEVADALIEELNRTAE